MGNTASTHLPTDVLRSILSRVPLREQNPYTVRATSKFICRLYDAHDQSVWLLLLPPSEQAGMTPEDITQQARRQCNEHLRALVLDALPESKRGAFMESGFRTLNLENTYITTLPAGKRTIHSSFTSYWVMPYWMTDADLFLDFSFVTSYLACTVAVILCVTLYNARRAR